jgi:hypothetical protein
LNEVSSIKLKKKVMSSWNKRKVRLDAVRGVEKKKRRREGGRARKESWKQTAKRASMGAAKGKGGADIFIDRYILKKRCGWNSIFFLVRVRFPFCFSVCASCVRWLYLPDAEKKAKKKDRTYLRIGFNRDHLSSNKGKDLK